MKPKHCYEIDYLRVIGASSVLLYHYTYRAIEINGVKISLFPYFEDLSKYGYLGVNLFFIISGFVILFSASNRSALNFAFTRADRLYPTYWACVTISSIAIIIFHGSPPAIQDYLANLTMGNDYIGIKNIDGVYWTLQVELKFYFLIFILILTKSIKKPHIYLPAWLTLAYIYYFTSQPFFMGWIISPFYSSYFISGISLYLLNKGQDGFQNIAVLVLSVILSIAYTWEQGNGFIRNISDQDRIVSCCIVLFIYLSFVFIVKRQFVKSKIRVVTKLSALTYSIYLIHASVGKRLFDFLANEFLLNKHISLIITVIVVWILSALINRFIEKTTSGKISTLAQRVMTIVTAGGFHKVKDNSEITQSSEYSKHNTNQPRGK